MKETKKKPKIKTEKSTKITKPIVCYYDAGVLYKTGIILEKMDIGLEEDGLTLHVDVTLKDEKTYKEIVWTNIVKIDKLPLHVCYNRGHIDPESEIEIATKKQGIVLATIETYDGELYIRRF